MTSDPASQAPVGVFDSGLGGLSVLKALQAQMPCEDFVYLADTGHAPYGERSDEFVMQRSLAIGSTLLGEHRIKALVVACNTATAAAAQHLRAAHPHLPVIGVEPGLKPAAALSRTGRVGVMATRGTLASTKFRVLHQSLAGQAEFVLQPCDGLADAIERGDTPRVAQLCKEYTHAMGEFGAAQGRIDTLVLGCTHYAFAQEQLRQAIGPAVQMIETGEPVARRARALLAAAGLVKPAGIGTLLLLSTGDLPALEALAARCLSRSDTQADGADSAAARPR